jgi:hypothetical protein
MLIFPLLVNISIFAIGESDIFTEDQFSIQTRGNSNNSDWIINNTTLISDQTIFLDGNLTITPSGNLTLRNTILMLNCTENGTYHIKVESGGTLLIEKSNITTSDPKYRSYWEVGSDSDYTLINTDVSNFGWDEIYLGLVIKTDNSYIYNS